MKRTANNIKIMLFDVDGVLVKVPYYFTKELEDRGYSNAQSILNSYYHGDEHQLCLEGQAKCSEKIAPYLERLGWEYSATEYLNQQFEFERNYLDQQMVNIITELRAKGLYCWLATDQEEHRAKYLLKEMSFIERFDGYFISCFMGARKISEDFWSQVIEQCSSLSSNPSEIAFFDDLACNIEAASRFGVNVRLFTNLQEFRNDLETFGLIVGSS